MAGEGLKQSGNVRLGGGRQALCGRRFAGLEVEVLDPRGHGVIEEMRRLETDLEGVGQLPGKPDHLPRPHLPINVADTDHQLADEHVEGGVDRGRGAAARNLLAPTAPSREERARETRRAIVEAAAALFAREGTGRPRWRR